VSSSSICFILRRKKFESSTIKILKAISPILPVSITINSRLAYQEHKHL
jgi:hypothetical protein